MTREFTYGAIIGGVIVWLYLRSTEYGTLTIIPRSEPLRVRGRPMLEQWREIEEESEDGYG